MLEKLQNESNKVKRPKTIRIVNEIIITIKLDKVENVELFLKSQKSFQL
jgi:hypothetical protein